VSVCSRTQVQFAIGSEIELVSQLIQGTFPNYSQLIPQSYTNRAIVDVEEFLRETRIAAIFARDGSGIVQCVAFNWHNDFFELDVEPEVAEQSLQVREALAAGRPHLQPLRLSLRRQHGLTMHAGRPKKGDAVEIESTGTPISPVAVVAGQGAAESPEWRLCVPSGGYPR